MRIKVPVRKDEKAAFCPICHASTMDNDYVPPTEWAIRHTADTGHVTICGQVYRYDESQEPHLWGTTDRVGRDC